MTKLLAALIAAAAALLALAAGPLGAAGAPRTLHFLDVTERSTPSFDAGTGAPRPGDRVFLRDGLYAWKSGHRGARVGHVDSTLTFLSGFGQTGATVEISGQMTVPGGSLLVDGIGRVHEGPNRFTLPVIGGTGAYAGARGTLELRDIGTSGDRSAVDVHLLP